MAREMRGWTGGVVWASASGFVTPSNRLPETDAERVPDAPIHLIRP